MPETKDDGYEKGRPTLHDAIRRITEEVRERGATFVWVTYEGRAFYYGGEAEGRRATVKGTHRRKSTPTPSENRR